MTVFPDYHHLVITQTSPQRVHFVDAYGVIGYTLRKLALLQNDWLMHVYLTYLDSQTKFRQDKCAKPQSSQTVHVLISCFTTY